VEIWFLVIGALLVAMALTSRLVQKLPLSPAMLYLAVGYLVGPGGVALMPVDLANHWHLIEVLAEVAVLVTLFAVGMRLRIPTAWRAWRIPLRLASLAMIVTIVIVMGAAVVVVGLPVAYALLLAAILAPTDPVLASDVQIREPGERDSLRLSLTAEGALNDGAAFPAVMLALGLIGAHSLGPFALRWITVDLLWAVAGGLAIGWLCGRAVATFVIQRLRRAGEALEHEEFLVLGVIALSYGISLTLATYGFLAVFAAGLALAHDTRRAEPPPNGSADQAGSVPVESTLSERLLAWSAQGERLIEVALVILLGALVGAVRWSWEIVAFAAVLLFVARPLAVLLTIRSSEMPRAQRRLVAWFGIRGIGSLYYLAYALDSVKDADLALRIADAAIATIAISIVAHGISATPLMERHERRRRLRA
jgi:NhaP-type Na+/H+ or K+/H+ antiporter